MWLETEVGERFSDIRLQEAVTEDIHTVVTTCPFCVQMLQDSTRSVEGANKVSVTELVTEMLPYLKSGEAAEETDISQIMGVKG